MQERARVFLAVLFGIFLFGSSVIAAGDARSINLPETAGPLLTQDDEDEPEVKARVARISFIRGEVRIRRAGSDEWEKAALNLPIVEGDEIATDGDARVEIQFDKNKHLRLAENAYLKIVNLKDEGIAVSLSMGRLNLRVSSFEKDKSFFEIDAPKTTIAVQKSGSYRVDAGRDGDSEIRVSAVEGELRVYSDSAGFTVKSGRSTRIFIDGPTSGEWETADASRFNDEFDDWSIERDKRIADRLATAHYDRYYDDDIYGADELNDHGAWIHTTDYGYVWRPHQASISHYADWSPYRYGHWRWMSPHGWIWVNDEPWGWATYHHGRWFHHNGYWHWSPYGYYRHRRSWWSPALVVISIVNNNVCWYPTPYYQRHRDYNAHNRRRRPSGNTPNVPATPPVRESAGILGRVKGPPKDPGRVPPEGVVTIGTDEFGRRVGGARTAPASVARGVISRDAADLPVVVGLPDGRETVRTRIPDFRAERPKVVSMQDRVGASKRRPDTPLDDELRTTRVFGGRPPQRTGAGVEPTQPVPVGESVPRKTGAIERPPAERPIRTVPKVFEPPPKDQPTYEPPTERVRPTREIRPVPKDVPRESPRYDPPAKTIEPRRDPPPVKQPPRESPPVRESPPPKQAPPPQKSEPKKEAKPDRPPEILKRKSSPID